MTAKGARTAELAAIHLAWADEQQMTVAFGHCSWKYIGLAGECRERARKHRDAKHPELTVKRLHRRVRHDREAEARRALIARREAEQA